MGWPRQPEDSGVLRGPGTGQGWADGWDLPYTQAALPGYQPGSGPFLSGHAFLVSETRPGKGLAGTFVPCFLLPTVLVPGPQSVCVGLGHPTQVGSQALVSLPAWGVGWGGVRVGATPPLPPSHSTPLTQTSWCSMIPSMSGPPTSQASWCGRQTRPSSD